MKNLSLLLLIGFVGSITANLCITKTLNFCQYGFNQNLNVSSTADWTNPGTLNFIVRSYYLQGIDGLLAVCNARQQFAQCLGDQYDACMSPLNFIASGESPADAQSYVQLFKTMEFDCNGGFIQSSRNWPCIATILQVKDDKLNECRQQYNTDLQKSPSALCQASADYETCVRRQFGTTCGSEVSWWACERTRRGLSIDSDCPSDTCSLVASGAAMTSSGDERPSKLVFEMQSDVVDVIHEISKRQKMEH
ncbi:hypothetical protein CRE_26790 [Caenorhabditis remanei]|uniref:DUF19 domain-containing protein n=1 Tax=Caenorhabditis remanei TaxID=31234 RepID=E3NGB6_CAERE|nr:hypothetical protein CRE_26790 [Caenorhabditis remanei]